MPSVSICIPSITKRSKLEEKYPDLIRKREEIENKFENISDSNRLRQLKELYVYYEGKAVNFSDAKDILNLGFNVTDAFDDCYALRPIYDDDHNNSNKFHTLIN